MAKRKGWTFSEEKKLIDSYHTKTIKELEVMFPGRSRESINNKIKRLKAQGKIKDGKTNTAKQRAYNQRGKDVFFTVDQAK
jgi:cytochrome c oxidase assembly protein Cox11